MSIHNALAGVAVRDLDSAQPWYERVLGSAGHRPMKEVAEWQFARGGALQVFQDPARAGKSSVTLVVPDLDEQLAELRRSGVEIVKTTSTAAVKTAIVHDPDDNQIVLAQALGEALAR
jgi:predicted enzyme related to lactoylglutathione lyase